MIHEEVAAAIIGKIPEIFRSIKTTVIEILDEQYATLTEVAAAATTVMP